MLRTGLPPSRASSEPALDFELAKRGVESTAAAAPAEVLVINLLRVSLFFFMGRLFIEYQSDIYPVAPLLRAWKTWLP